jgi:enoyl-CoA hydratase
MASYKYLTYELLDEGTIARIMLNRPGSRNAQNRGLLVELGEAMLAAEADDQVRVVILGGAGPMFSAGHDLGSREWREEHAPVARPAQDHGRPGTGRGVRRGAHADVGVRPDRRG